MPAAYINADRTNALAFRNPETNEVENIQLSWLYILLFGPLYFLYKRIWLHAFLCGVLSIFFLPFSTMVYAYFSKTVLRKYYNDNDWIPENITAGNLIPKALFSLFRNRPFIKIFLEPMVHKAMQDHKSASGWDKLTGPNLPTDEPVILEPFQAPKPPEPKYDMKPEPSLEDNSEKKRNRTFNIIFAIGGLIIIIWSLELDFELIRSQIESFILEN